MIRICSFIVLFLLNLAFFFAAQNVAAQETTIDNEVVSFRKKELNKGFVFQLSRENSDITIDELPYSLESTAMSGLFRIENNVWNIEDYKQEAYQFSFDLGPFSGAENWEGSSDGESDDFDVHSYGVQAALNGAYLTRFYYDPRNYTVFSVSGWGQYNLYRQKQEGNPVGSSEVDESDTKDNLLFGLSAKTGLGIGRLSPMNHLMTAHFLLEKYYPGRVFSDFEIAQFAQVIAGLKHRRDYKTTRTPGWEEQMVSNFLNKNFLLEAPEALPEDWGYGEFDPRYEGNRFEIGPFFQYYNEDPDFIYGGFMQFDWAKYQSVKWNRDLSASISYNRYHDEQQWMSLELQLGWSYYPNLRSRFDFGAKYISGLELDGFDEDGTISHNIIPYVSYFTQLTSKSRIQLDCAWRIADDEQFVIPGPEFSLSIYRSRY